MFEKGTHEQLVQDGVRVSKLVENTRVFKGLAKLVNGHVALVDRVSKLLDSRLEVLDVNSFQIQVSFDVAVIQIADQLGRQISATATCIAHLLIIVNKFIVIFYW